MRLARRLLVAALLPAIAIPIVAAVGGTTVEATEGCYAYTIDCTNPSNPQPPSSTACSASAITARSNTYTVPSGATAGSSLTVELRYSTGCATGWGRLGSRTCSYPGYPGACPPVLYVWVRREAPYADTNGSAMPGSYFSRQLYRPGSSGRLRATGRMTNAVTGASIITYTGLYY